MRGAFPPAKPSRAIPRDELQAHEVYNGRPAGCSRRDTPSQVYAFVPHDSSLWLLVHALVPHESSAFISSCPVCILRPPCSPRFSCILRPVVSVFVSLLLMRFVSVCVCMPASMMLSLYLTVLHPPPLSVAPCLLSHPPCICPNCVPRHESKQAGNKATRQKGIRTHRPTSTPYRPPIWSTSLSGSTSCSPPLPRPP